MKIFQKPIAFEWDKGNRGKNLRKHRVTDGECEEVFFDPRKKILRDTLHSVRELRYIILGQTKGRRLLLVVFTIRGERIRIISSRDLSRKEKNLYYEEKT